MVTSNKVLVTHAWRNLARSNDGSVSREQERVFASEWAETFEYLLLRGPYMCGL